MTSEPVQPFPTPEEIDHLKKSWLADPCWDIEDTEGFEAHRAELLAFRLEQDKISEQRAKERNEREIQSVMKRRNLPNAVVARMVLYEEWQAERNKKSALSLLIHLFQVTASGQQADEGDLESLFTYFTEAAVASANIDRILESPEAQA